MRAAFVVVPAALILIAGIWTHSALGQSTPATAVAADSFNRTVSAGWGSADAGGVWTTVGTPPNWSVSPSTGSMTVAANGEQRAYLSAVNVQDVDLVAKLVLPQSTQAADHTLAYLLGRYVAAYTPSYYRIGVGQAAGGATVIMRAQRSDGTFISSDLSAGIPAANGVVVWLHVQFQGVNPTAIRARAWPDGTAEPTTWTLDTTDANAAEQVAGAVGVRVRNEDTSASHTFQVESYQATGTAVPAPGPTPNPTGSTAHHFMYVFPDGEMDAYDLDNSQALVKRVVLPTSGVVGAAVSPSTGVLYVSECGSTCDSPSAGGQMLKYNLLTDTVAWIAYYAFGVDSIAITPDGKTIYSPDGESSTDGMWHTLDAGSGAVTGSIFANVGGHDTIVGLSGAHAYLGGWENGANYDYLQVVDTTTNSITEKIGPLTSGVRPFTVNGTETLAFTTATNFLGFQVSSITTGQVLYTVPVSGFTWTAFVSNAPSHGISLSPDEKELYLMDGPNYYVHVFDVSGLPSSPPRQVADIPLTPMTGSETPCASRCEKEGWLLHSRDGRFVYVGQSGDVIDTSTRTIVAHLSTLANTRQFLEVDWQNGSPTFTSSRFGLGYVTATDTATPTATDTPTPTSTSTPTPALTATDTATPTPTSTPTPIGNVFTVTTAADSGPGSLRQAVLNANAAAPGPNEIVFDIAPGGVQTILLLSPLPTITVPVTIDGTTQPGYAGMPIIELDGSSAGTSANGLTVGAGHSTIAGLAIGGFSDNGIALDTNGGDTVQRDFIGTDQAGNARGNGGDSLLINGSPNNLIGGTTVSARNVLSGNLINGVEIRGVGATGNRVQGNFIGADVNGTASLPNHFDGVMISSGASNNTIGGMGGARNVIGFNASNGIEITGTGSNGNVVEGNFIGPDATGMAALGNGENGVIADGGASRNTIGTPGLGNVISGNSLHGVAIQDAGTTFNLVQANFIGTTSDGTSTLWNGNAGVFLGGAGAPAGNTIGGNSAGAGNIIAHNLYRGVDVSSGTDDAILGNSIFDDAYAGIHLDPGANNNQAAPALTGASSDGGGTTVTGTLTAAPNTLYRLEFYSDLTCETPAAPQGRELLGVAYATADGSGTVSFTETVGEPVTPGQIVTATATDPAANTSPFSGCATVTSQNYCQIRRADLDGDGEVSILDLAAVASNFLETVPPAPARYDQDGDGQITILDLAQMAGVFLQPVSACP